DRRFEDGRINQANNDKREEWLLYQHLDQLIRDDLWQECCLKWVMDGDENYHFFHLILGNKYAIFSIKGVLIDGVWYDNPDEINSAAFNHFSASLWDVVKNKFWNCIKYFECSGHFANGYNPSFNVLIPKRNDPIGFSYYCPISLIGCVYKVIAKLLVNRLAMVIDSIIGPNQSTFIKGQKIIDGSFIANEIIRMASLENYKLFLLWVDDVSSRSVPDQMEFRDDGGFQPERLEHRVQALRFKLMLSADNVATRWLRHLPIKINVFLWRLSINRLPSRVNLDRKGIDVDSLLCPICRLDVETVNHFFFNCDMAKDLWALVAKWWELDVSLCSNILDWYSWLDGVRLTSMSRSILEGVGGTLMWTIWFFRNKLIFSSTPPKKASLWDFIVAQSFLWFSSRNPKNKISWLGWLKTPSLNVSHLYSF
nr:RNA-directed DNA polymerase, eukaryota [Tanacetum cinerariifolium]